jgi:UTP--glucose-1-phosphate uridylyltransferase
MHLLVEVIRSASPEARAGALERYCSSASPGELADAARQLHFFAVRPSTSAHQRARALLQAYAIHRFFLPQHASLGPGRVPAKARSLLLDLRFSEAIELLTREAEQGLSTALSSALACAYRAFGFHVLADEVQRAVRQQTGNRWMFRTSHALDYPLRLRPELALADASGRHAMLTERTPVRMDLTHSGYSDIFTLAMDYPEGARVLNVSVDLAVLGRGELPAPPIHCSLRVIDEPVLRLCSVDLGAHADLSEVSEVFDYARDALGLLKAAVVASGIVPAGFEGSGQRLAPLLESLIGQARGLEIVSQVHDIPKGSRLAVSTNLLASLIALCMRATSQLSQLEGPPTEAERRIIAGRAILGEWLGGSGGGWQDSGGLWPGIKLIQGVAAVEGDAEFGTSPGCLLPRHTVLGPDVVSEQARRQLQDSLVVVHGGMAANVGPILEMVSERFLLGTSREWQARQQLLAAFDEMVGALSRGDVRELGRLTTRAFEQPLQAMIPEASNAYTERLIAAVRHSFGERFWGFWMMGGMSGGGMGFLFDPTVRASAEARLQEIMQEEKRALEHGMSFSMDPVVYRTAVNGVGTTAVLCTGSAAVQSREYYLHLLPHWLQEGSQSFSPARRAELDVFSARYLSGSSAEQVGKALIGRLFPAVAAEPANGDSLSALLQRHGFDREQHEQLRADLKGARIGLSQNRLPHTTALEDAREEDVMRPEQLTASCRRRGEEALQYGQVAVVTLAGGAGSRWTRGAGTVKALYPFTKLAGSFRSFLDVHLAKTRQTRRLSGKAPVHIFTTGHLTHDPISNATRRAGGEELGIYVSPARSIGLRLIPTRRDLEFAWHPARQQKLEERKQKVLDSAREALLTWALSSGEGADYLDNAPMQCVYPLGHWYEVANLLLNGTLGRALRARTELRYLLLHNIDTVGAALDPAWLGEHIERGYPLSFEVVQRGFEDRGGGLARVAGRLRLIEEMALPREEDEARLSYYNSLTTWISIDPLLALFGLTREQLDDDAAVLRGARALAARMPTYVTLKEVRRRWDATREDTLLVTQCEKLWGDMSSLPDVTVGYFLVPRCRGQQLKEPAHLDGWRRDGSSDYVESLCDFE